MNINFMHKTGVEQYSHFWLYAINGVLAYDSRNVYE